MSRIVGADLARLMNGVGGEAIAAALIGCNFQTQKSDDAGEDGFPILAVDIGTSQVTVTGSNGSASSALLARGHVELSQEADAAVSEVRNRLAVPYPDDAKTLREHGITVEMTRSDAVIVARALRDTGMPEERQRFDVLEVMKQYELSEQVRSLVQRWANVAKPIPVDVAIQLATSHRASGELDEALRTIGASMEDAAAQFQQKVILLTQSAAVFLDRFERDSNPADLRHATHAYEKAKSLDPNSTYLSRVAARLRALCQRHETSPE